MFALFDKSPIFFLVFNLSRYHIHKASTDKNNPYTKLNKESMFEAMQNLKYNEFKIYMYLASNQNGYEIALSPADISKKTGAAKREIQRSINSLIEKGYLIPTDENHYIFIEDVHLCLDDTTLTPMVKNTIPYGEKHHTLW